MPSPFKKSYSSYYLLAIIFIVILALNFFQKKNKNTILSSESVVLNDHDVLSCFTPGENCEEKIVEVIEQSQKSIEVQAYSFTSEPISQALSHAAKRGVEVRVLLDKSNIEKKYPASLYLMNSLAHVWIDSKHAIAHNKVMLIDHQTLITGSYNFTQAALKKNAENLLIIHSQDLAAHYFKNWETHLQHSENISSLSFAHPQAPLQQDE